MSFIYIRYLQACAFVIVYISLGFAFRLKTEAYLLLGIPLSILFQLVVARQPLINLWLRQESTFTLRPLGWIITLCFLIYPVSQVIVLGSEQKLSLLDVGFYSAVCLGAFGAGFCYSRFTRSTAKYFLLCFGSIGLLRSALYFLPFIVGQKELEFDFGQGITSLLLYIPIAFVVEEVVFRSMLDRYIHRSKKTDTFFSAFFISCLWGLWHLPLSLNKGNSLWFTAIAAMLISVWGIFLSIFWRKTGNLAVPGFSHAFADAVRDALR